MGHRSRSTSPLPAAKSSSPSRGLLLWGGLNESGELFLEPVFVVGAPPLPPRLDGPYRLTGEDEKGDEIFTQPFGMPEYGCGGRGGSFAFILPVGTDWPDRLERIVLRALRASRSWTARKTPPPRSCWTAPREVSVASCGTGRRRPANGWPPPCVAGTGAGGADQPRPAGFGLVGALSQKGFHRFRSFNQRKEIHEIHEIHALHPRLGWVPSTDASSFGQAKKKNPWVALGLSSWFRERGSSTTTNRRKV